MGRVRRSRRGRDDQPADARQSARRGGIDQTGKVFALNLPIDIPNPPLFTRQAHRHTVKEFPAPMNFVLDDYLDNFYPQASSQWDALAHVKHPEHGAYNGIPDHEMTGRGGTRLGIDNLARRGIAGRGVLADIGRHYAKVGKSIEYDKAQSIRRGSGGYARRAEIAVARWRYPADSHWVTKLSWRQHRAQRGTRARNRGAGNRGQPARRAMAVGASPGRGRVGFAGARGVAEIRRTGVLHFHMLAFSGCR